MRNQGSSGMEGHLSVLYESLLEISGLFSFGRLVSLLPALLPLFGASSFLVKVSHTNSMRT